MNEDLKLICKIYENKLSDLLNKNDWDELQHKCFRMLQIHGIEKSDPGDWKDFQIGLVKPTKEEMEEYKEITKGWC